MDDKISSSSSWIKVSESDRCRSGNRVGPISTRVSSGDESEWLVRGLGMTEDLLGPKHPLLPCVQLVPSLFQHAIIVKVNTTRLWECERKRKAASIPRCRPLEGVRWAKGNETARRSF